MNNILSHFFILFIAYNVYYKTRNQSQKPETSRKNQKPMAKRSGTFAEHSPQPKARQEKKGI
jgi:hypothetical protein